VAEPHGRKELVSKGQEVGLEGAIQMWLHMLTGHRNHRGEIAERPGDPPPPTCRSESTPQSMATHLNLLSAEASCLLQLRIHPQVTWELDRDTIKLRVQGKEGGVQSGFVLPQGGFGQAL
jgi:hypothetical protein